MQGPFCAAVLSSKHTRKTRLDFRVDGPDVPGFENFDNYLKSAMKYGGCRHAAAAVIRNGKLLWIRAMTWAEVEYDMVTVHSPFRIASLTKPITGTAMMKLWENGQKGKSPSVDLDATAVQALGSKLTPLPSLELHPDWQMITVDALLQHKAGLRGYTTTAADVRAHFQKITGSWPPSPMQRGDLLTAMAGKYPKGGKSSPVDPATFGVRTYSNGGFFLLGAALSNLNTSSYGAACRELIFAPLGVPNPAMVPTAPTTALGDPAKQVVGEAFYNPNVPKCTPNNNLEGSPIIARSFDENFEFLIGAGSWRMSILDYARFTAGHHPDGLLLDRSTRNKMWEIGANRGWGVTALGSPLKYFYCANHGGLLYGGTWSTVTYFWDEIAVVTLRAGYIRSYDNPAFRGLVDGVTPSAWSGPDLFPLYGYSSF